MKNFKNTFGVTGTLALRKAFRDELLALGWKQQGKDEIELVKYIYCSNSNDHSLKANHFWYPGIADDAYKLPQQWELALKAASEVVEEIPEYVECIRTGNPIYNNFTLGKIYKVIKLDKDILTTLNDSNREERVPNVLSKGSGAGLIDFKPSTKEAYDAQNKSVSETLVLGTSNIKITVYKDGTIIAEDKNGTIKMIKQLIEQMQNAPFIGKWDSIYTSIKIGCSTFTLDELKQIVTAYDKLNQLEW